MVRARTGCAVAVDEWRLALVVLVDQKHLRRPIGACRGIRLDSIPALVPVTTGANAGNMLQSGKTLKELQRFGSDYEDQRSGSYLDRLFGLSGMGQQATGQQVAMSPSWC